MLDLDMRLEVAAGVRFLFRTAARPNAHFLWPGVRPVEDPRGLVAAASVGMVRAGVKACPALAL